MKHHSAQPATGHVGNLAPDQWDALGEIWCFLLHLWYSEPSSGSSKNPLSNHPRRSSSYSAPTTTTTTTATEHGDHHHHHHDILHRHPTRGSSASSPPPPLMAPTSPGSSGNNYHPSTERNSSPQPASPTRLSQSFYQPSVASSPHGATSPIMNSNGNGGGGGGGHALISSLPGGAAAAAAALKRSAAKLKPWLPAKKFTFKYSPSEYQSAFWAFVQSEHPDTTVLRFLRARKWNVEKAMEMLILALEWRITMGVDEVVTEGEEALEQKYPGFLDQLKNGKVIFRGHDREGRPLCLLDPSLHNPNAQSHQAVQKLSIYVIETARMLLRPPIETISVVFDMSSFSMSNMDWPTTKFFIHAAEACYPELLGVCVVHKAPWIFGALWKMISPMLDPVIRAKIKFTNSRRDLEEFVAPDQLMSTKAYEGDDHTPYHYQDPLPDENIKMQEDSDAKTRAIHKRKELELTFERLTEIWQGQKQLSSSAAVIQERNEVGQKMAEIWWAAEPYTRARTNGSGRTATTATSHGHKDASSVTATYGAIYDQNLKKLDNKTLSQLLASTGLPLSGTKPVMAGRLSACFSSIMAKVDKVLSLETTPPSRLSPSPVSPTELDPTPKSCPTSTPIPSASSSTSTDASIQPIPTTLSEHQRQVVREMILPDSIVSIDIGIRNFAWVELSKDGEILRWSIVDLLAPMETNPSLSQNESVSDSGSNLEEFESKQGSDDSVPTDKRKRYKKKKEPKPPAPPYDPRAVALRLDQLMRDIFQERGHVNNSAQTVRGIVLEQQRFRTGGMPTMLDVTFKCGVVEGMIHSWIAAWQSLQKQPHQTESFFIEAVPPKAVSTFWGIGAAGTVKPARSTMNRRKDSKSRDVDESINGHKDDTGPDTDGEDDLPAAIEDGSGLVSREVKGPKYMTKKLQSRLIVDGWLDSNSAFTQASPRTDEHISMSDAGLRAWCGPEIMEFYKQERKRDDLSDCVLQAVAWYEWRGRAIEEAIDRSVPMSVEPVKEDKAAKKKATRRK
ncbi:hypothetical protein BGZ83_007665 [Gryganskiella cystojenkinii]|nr:hypothetical protein BGZ83_007665 [Gryganskiella cystojenkinii]